MKKNYFIFKIALIMMPGIPLVSIAQDVATFDSLSLDAGSFWNGSTSSYGEYSTTKQDSIFTFENHFSRLDYGFGLMESWGGFSYSKMKDDTTAGYNNQYSAITAGGAKGSENYAVFNLAMGRDTVLLSKDDKLDSVFITNSTYAYLSMKEGDMFAKQFGGTSGDDEDWFLLTIRGLRDGVATDTIEFYLADYSFADNGQDYIVDEWIKVDLADLDTVDMLEFSLTSSDTGDYGMNTPAFFCLDNLSGATFEDLTFTSGEYWNGKSACYGSYPTSFSDGMATFPLVYSINDYGYGVTESFSGFAYSNMKDSTTAGFTNQYSAFPAIGADGSETYALCKNSSVTDSIVLDAATALTGTYITNGTYAVKSMQNGDMFSKQFGGASGDDADWFLLSIYGKNGGNYTDTVEFYLADYRFANNEEDYIVTDWEWVDLSGLGTVDMLEFSLSSSDTGAFGMNTPAYFFIDNFNGDEPVVNTPQEKTTLSDNIKVYPNPFTSFIKIESGNEIASIRLMDISGKIITMMNVNGNSESVEIELNGLESGMYFLQVNGLKSSVTKQIIKK